MILILNCSNFFPADVKAVPADVEVLPDDADVVSDDVKVLSDDVKVISDDQDAVVVLEIAILNTSYSTFKFYQI